MPCPTSVTGVESVHKLGFFRPRPNVAGGNVRFSSIFPDGDVSRGGTSATQRQKFHTDDVNQCLRNISGSHGGSTSNFVQFYVSPGRFY